MKNLTVLLTGFVMALVVCGCRPQLAQVELGENEASWDEYFRQNYSSYNPPRTAPPAIRDNRTPEALAEVGQMNGNAGVSGAAAAPGGVPAMEFEPMNVSAVEIGETAAVAPVAAPVAAADAAAVAPVAPTAAGTEYKVLPGDSLSKIAKKFYKNGRKYQVILKHNPQLKNSPNKLRPGMVLLIPQL